MKCNSRLITLKEADKRKYEGYVSTTRLLEIIGINRINADFIENELGIHYTFETTNRSSFYWSPEQVSKVRRALIEYLLRAEFDDPKSPYNSPQGNET